MFQKNWQELIKPNKLKTEAGHDAGRAMRHGGYRRRPHFLARHRRIQTIHAIHRMLFVLTRKLLIYQLIHDWMLVRCGDVCM